MAELIPELIEWLLLGCLVFGTCTFLLSKCFFLAPWRAGFLLMLASVVYETAFKKARLQKWQMDLAAFPLLVGGWWFFGGAELAVVSAMILALAWGGALISDLQWRTGALAHQHRGYGKRVPLPVPELIVVVRGPVLYRRPRRYELGDWPEGWEADFELLVVNPSVIRPQLPLEIELSGSLPGFVIQGEGKRTVVCPEPGGLERIVFRLRAISNGSGATATVRVTHGDFGFCRILRLRSVVPRARLRIQRAEVTRWKYGARAAFAWRGDQDLYDPATLQSEEGLRLSLGLSQRFRLPTTLFLSGRLSLVEEEHRRFCQRFGWDRCSGEIPAFIRFLRDEVEIQPELDWPVSPRKSFAAELGNHMYLHYGTHAAADEGNNWTSHTPINAGRYPWDTGSAKDSFTEQRDNASKNAALIKDLFGAEMITYAIPSNLNDANTARAVEAAGLEIGSDTDCGAFVNVFKLPAPHHPPGCHRLVELTRKYPRDPDDASQVAVLKYWAHAARRTGRPFILLCHHHLTRYEGVASMHLMEKLLADILGGSEGDFYPATMGAIGRYWMRVLDPENRWIRIRTEGTCVTLSNGGKAALIGLPVEIEMEGGGRFLCLVDLKPGETRRIHLA
ncbi:MAG: hypothetical protein AB9869_13975 [Verrucomicrobiia bacterium]